MFEYHYRTHFERKRFVQSIGTEILVNFFRVNLLKGVEIGFVLKKIDRTVHESRSF